MIPDVLKKVEEFSGLKFEFVYADSYSDSLDLVKKGKADMLGSFLGTDNEGARMNLAVTKPYAVLNDIIAVSYTHLLRRCGIRKEMMGLRRMTYR